MVANFSNSYIDRIFAEKDLDTLHQLIEVVGKRRALPDVFWLFSNIYEWAPARSGVWQYYENLPDETFLRVMRTLNRHGLTEIAEKYEFGRNTWDSPDRGKTLDKWLESHVRQIHDAIFALVLEKKDSLKLDTD